MLIGTAQIDICPDFEVELAGFAARKHPCIGVCDPIFARAIYLEQGSERLLWIAADLLAFQPEFVDAFRAWARQELSLAPEQVMLSATHTHSAPTAIHITGAGTYSQRYVDLLHQRMQQAARQAMSRTAPCDVVTARSRLDLAIDRRNKPTKHVDPTIWAIGFRRRASADFIAAIVNYAMHPVSLGAEERRISPDWPGGTYEKLAALLPGGPMVVVANGAAGNLNPPHLPSPRDETFRWGERVAEAIADPLRAAAPIADPALSVRSVHVDMPLDYKDAAEIDRLADVMLRDVAAKTIWPEPFKQAAADWRTRLKALVATGGGRTRDIELHAARIGDVLVIAVNGEMFNRFTDDVRAASGVDKLFVVGFANRGYGYIPTREAYAEGGYETDLAHFFYGSFRPAAGSLELLAEKAATLARSMS